ncbi:MAG TPA: hypothetical protein VGO04_22650 [Ensifer sp.]|jgi:hypothetical protein|uniref:hypothetical protein n=1 Tax=Ensifer sp. TaxID=1872086 RepID=UPI002E154AB9|nr:hypothetical protein [Ensifer sp.]
MNDATRRVVYATATILSAIYLVLFYFALDGYGYSGHGGSHARASRWYWGGPETFHDPNNRAGSVDGTNRLGGGPESGK